MAGHAYLGRVHQAGQRAVWPTTDGEELTDDGGHVTGLMDQVAFVRGAHVAVGEGNSTAATTYPALAHSCSKKR